ncbi:ROK family protein [Neobacillus mesonae]|nr:ROK family protein [Neobacillus mesonae]
MRIGAVEAGGTKFVCGVGNEHGQLEESISFPTEGPDKSLARVISYFKEKEIEALGIGSFGPLDLRKNSSTYGFITTTPKPGWGNCDVLGRLGREFDIPLGWDTDVNAAAVGEATWGSAAGLGSCVYYTIGTGVGIGIYSEGKPVHGLIHPEGGHFLTRRNTTDRFVGICPYHGDCLEGMASGPAIEARWKCKGQDLPPNHAAWELEAYYLAQSIAGVILIVSPQKIILGGGVMQQTQLYPLIREAVRQNLNGYVQASELVDNMENYIVPPSLGQQAGLYGSLALGYAAYQDKNASAC